MNESEKAAKKYTESHPNSKMNYPEWDGVDVYDAFIAGAQWQSKQSPWITVADKEPDEFKNVLLSAGSCPSIFVGHLNGEDFVVASTGEIVEYFRVLHWMPIPE